MKLDSGGDTLRLDRSDGGGDGRDCAHDLDDGEARNEWGNSDELRPDRSDGDGDGRDCAHDLDGGESE
ncbi:hypothetical protein KU306_01425 [Haloferax larsenii]|uniref:Uncharacterized protein n=1 Tax=Haloferax larsenii TaxID=302484 RepID=A0ABY5RE25_HALLR|nr:hypothetical protein [Haloferax larsenii]UVE50594.1 hypothetical protein KU306_01425 [Haloferax larsenii]